MQIAIIGNGISGITAARYLRKDSDHEITVISSETDYFFSRTALMYIYMGHMNYEHTKPFEDWFWEKNKINLLNRHVEEVDFDHKNLRFSNGETFAYDKLILATGSSPNKFGWPGQDLRRVQGLYSYQDLEALQSYSDEIETAVIVGGGLIGIELAEMLKSKGKEVIFLVREASFWNMVLPKEESEMINQHILEHHIDLRLETEIAEILDDGQGNVKGVKLKDESIIDCQFVGLTVGVHPNISFLKDTKLATEKGILVNEFLETNIPDVYALGDCVQHQNPPPGRRPLEQIWYTGKIMGETIAKTILGDKTTYQPGVFYNSAKFLDIEYQTYGAVPATPEEGTEDFYWQSPVEHKLVRIHFKKDTKAVTGVNTFGIRMRQGIWQNWIEKETSVEEVLINLGKANFDPEFFKKHEQDIIEAYNEQYGASLKLKNKKTGLMAIFQ
ncbi:NAD(P)/FAD-dependent oxidoreductase [Jiulongibacter sediminis]|uniref:NADH dehydrogenase n=1 Tax=Jiulongibacter sediminis TaxID=1605367 RepID=A0A0P7CAI0_9BACT|nr:FAD-dependent oxidoreductase [Jiulongibacter sediminis]KPM49674.1 NADH dehydrogenase [Jiulongibacter sediminis]TBX26712.1 NADH dehydrogenase [Jiulongibacter sediminis]